MYAIESSVAEELQRATICYYTDTHNIIPVVTIRTLLCLTSAPVENCDCFIK